MVVNDVRFCCEDAKWSMAGYFLRLVGHIKHPDIQLIIFFDLDDAIHKAVGVDVV